MKNLGSVEMRKPGTIGGGNQERWVGTTREKGKTNKTGESNGKQVN